MRVLIIEDNQNLAKTIQEYLQQKCPDEDIVFEIVPLLSEAIERTNTQEYDIILLDLCLPDSSPKKTLDQLSGVMKKMPTIVMSGLDNAVAGLLSIEMGAKEFVCKVDIVELVDAFARLKNKTNP